jgi:hypothetical protein
VFLSVLVLGLTLPAEMVLLKALQSPDDQTEAQQWSAELSSAELTVASSNLEAYPFVYRREIMRALPADGRAAAWRGHIQKYLSNHGSLSEAAVVALRNAQAALTPSSLSDKASSRELDRLNAAAAQLEAVLGKDAALYIAHDLGPRDLGMLAGAQPLLLKLASVVRGQFAMLARLEDCDCADDFTCGYYTSYCSTSQACRNDNSWPMCGYWWNTPCNGLCSAI